MNKELFELYKIDYLEGFKNYLVFFKEIGEDDFDIEETLPISKLEEFRDCLKENTTLLEEYDKKSSYKEKLEEGEEDGESVEFDDDEISDEE